MGTPNVGGWVGGATCLHRPPPLFTLCLWLFVAAEEQNGPPSFEYLRDIQDTEDVKKELGRFKGLGPKTISCVLLFAMGRPEFPVDTHVMRIAKTAGWVGPGETRESTYAILNAVVEDHVKMDLHCLLVKHGKVCHACAANGKPQFPPEGGGKLKCPMGRERVRAEKPYEGAGGAKKAKRKRKVKDEKEEENRVKTD